MSGNVRRTPATKPRMAPLPRRSPLGWWITKSSANRSSSAAKSPAFDLEAVRPLEAGLLEHPDHGREVDPAVAEGAEQPIALAALGVLQVHLDDPIDNLPQVLGRIETLVVVVDVAGVVVDADGRV